MKKGILFLLILVTATVGFSQKVDSIYFHLYTDSLKKGFYNYINVDGKTSDGRWLPLSSNDIILVVNDSLLRFQNNDLFIDSAYQQETVNVKAFLKINPAVWKETTIYIRKRGFTEPLKSNEEILNGTSRPRRNNRNLTSS